MPLPGCGFMKKLRARDNLNKGVKAFTDQKYDAATQYFQKSIDLDPELTKAHVYLATTYMSQFVPGSVDPKSEEMAAKAIKTFTHVAEMVKDPEDPDKKSSMLATANLFYQMRRFDESKDWCSRVLKIDPQNAEAYYRIAVMDFEDANEKTGLQGENVEYLSPEEKSKALQNIEQGLTCLNKALEIRPNYFDAMQYQNLLWREKAKFEKDEKVKMDLIRQADLVAQKAVQLELKYREEEAKKAKKLGALGGGK
jgi:tetratricopeptide (TPR) repeat protein